MIKRICQCCGKHFFIYSCWAKRGGKYCSRKCSCLARRTRIKRICSLCGGEFIAIPSKLEKGWNKYCSLECKGKASRDKPLHSKESKEKISNSAKKRYINPKNNPFYGKHHSPEERKRRSDRSKKQWENPTIARKMLEGLQIRPTKPELQLKTILDNHFPQFKYNGDFSLGVTLGGLIPDFVNIDGRKEVIEVFGKYWHSKSNIRWNYTELGRVMAYNSLGYKCLVIWEDELKGKTETETIGLIKDFFKEEKGEKQRGRIRSLKK